MDRLLQKCTRLVLAGLLALLSWASFAQTYPTRPINWLVPTEPGGTLDMLSRSMTRPLSDKLGVPFVIENRPGANFTIAASACAKAKPDGYTLCTLVRDNFSILPHEGPVPYDPVKDFAPVANLAWITSVIFAQASLPVNNFRELAEYSRKHPNTLNYTAFGAAQLSMEWFKKQTNADLTFIPFKGSPAALTAFFGGHIQVLNSATAAPGVAGMIKSGKVKGMMVPGDNRNPLFPDVPTAVELGLPRFNTLSWAGIFSAAGTPREALNRLSSEMIGLVKTPEFQAKNLHPYGLDPIGQGPDQFAAFILQDMKEGAELVKSAGPRTR
jgi:tripartite-type tricarboxylate transporter receptor subunit TctC